MDSQLRPTRLEVEQLFRFSKPWRTHGFKGAKYPDITTGKPFHERRVKRDSQNSGRDRH